MGFRTLAIQKRSSEVWQLLAAVKTKFGKYDEVLDRVQKKLAEASNQIENELTRRKRVIDRKLWSRCPTRRRSSFWRSRRAAASTRNSTRPNSRRALVIRYSFDDKEVAVIGGSALALFGLFRRQHG